jgi:hypothetical protein
MKHKEYRYGIGEGRGQEMKSVWLPLPETTKELARLFRRVPVKQYAKICEMAAEKTGGDIGRMASYFYAMTVFPRLRARAQRRK